MSITKLYENRLLKVSEILWLCTYFYSIDKAIKTIQPEYKSTELNRVKMFLAFV